MVQPLPPEARRALFDFPPERSLSSPAPTIAPSGAAARAPDPELELALDVVRPEPSEVAGRMRVGPSRVLALLKLAITGAVAAAGLGAGMLLVYGDRGGS